MITDINYYKKVGKRLFVFICTLLALYIAFKLSIFYIPFLIAFIISLLIEPLIRKVMSFSNLTRKSSAIITLVVVFIIIIALLIWGITSLITEATNILENLNKNMEVISNKIYNFNFESIKIPEQIKTIIESGFQEIIEEGKNIAQKILTNTIDRVTQIPKLFIYIGITIIATYFICTDKMYIVDQLEHHLPRNWVNKFGKKLRKVISSLGDYLKAEGILILISFIILLIGLVILKLTKMNIQYPLVMALFIAFIDALPILGAGIVMIPWAILSASNGNITLAISLIILYVIIIVTRQLIEPRIVSSHIGIHPIFTLISMYTGFKIVGVTGIVIGPIVLIILKNIFETMIDNGVIKTILDRK